MRIIILSLLVLTSSALFSQSATQVDPAAKGPYHRVGTYMIASAACFGTALLTRPVVDRLPDTWQRPGLYSTISYSFAIAGIVFGAAAGQELKQIRPVADYRGVGVSFTLR